MFLVHYWALASKSQKQDALRLKELFLNTHRFDSLWEYLRSEDSQEQPSATPRKSVVLTHSKYSTLGLEAAEVLLSDLEEHGSEFLKARLQAFLHPKEPSRHLVLHFNTAQSAQHFTFLRYQVDNWLVEFANEDVPIDARKHIVLAVYKPCVGHGNDINFFEGEWIYQVVEDFQHCGYAYNMSFLDSSTRDILTILERDQNSFSQAMFLAHLRQLPLKKHCRDIVQNQLLPVLSLACDRGEPKEASVLVNVFHKLLVDQVDFSLLGDWKQLLLDSPVYKTVQATIIDSCGQEYSKCLKQLVLRFKKQHLLGTVVSLGWLPAIFQTHFMEIFLERVPSELTKLK